VLSEMHACYRLTWSTTWVVKNNFRTMISGAKLGSLQKLWESLE